MRLRFSLVAFALVLAAGPAAASEWCGFHAKAHSQVKCGFSSYAECHATIGSDKDAICRPNPGYARLRGSRTAG